ncbi:VWA domain-containing protein [Porticoccus litoralis]|uniref:VWA domain-containing protein n=1 Tax=Porticoccus litoralis TaxID=434086 RepID=A0AAW8B3I8_9GAMM|nr:VWA domain-containing protein [Porticoccus litoralis]MDP1520982.1 VWA domain-containing protein [Porticoccus litoralis]
MNRGRRRERGQTPEISISFLDVISCGFGAIVLLLLIAKTVESTAFEQTDVSLNGSVAELQQQLFEIRGEVSVLNRDLNSREEQLSEIQLRIARLQSELASVRRQRDAIAQVDTTEQDKLTLALQTLTEEMKRLQALQNRSDKELIGGIPVDSEYIVFIVDTSGSMFNFAWPRLRQEMIHILDIYPKVKGIQVMNDMGGYMFSSYRGKWIPDTPARRRAIIERLAHWTPFSNSSPVEGVQHAIRSFYAPNRKISLYVLGDDFTGDSIDNVLDTVAKINREGRSGERLVRIHTIGFPVHFLVRGGNLQTASRFAALMRELSYRNGGTFVALNGLKPE